jgi:hypothetical protein
MKIPYRATIVVFSLIPIVSKAQWITSGSDTYFNLSGYVGTGTT